MQHLTEEQLILFHYDELEAGQDVAAHLADCAGCRRNYETLTQALGQQLRLTLCEAHSSSQPDLIIQPRL